MTDLQDQEYWYFTLFIILIVIGSTFLAALMPNEVFAIILPIGYIVCLIPSLSLWCGQIL